METIYLIETLEGWLISHPAPTLGPLMFLDGNAAGKYLAGTPVHKKGPGGKKYVEYKGGHETWAIKAFPFEPDSTESLVAAIQQNFTKMHPIQRELPKGGQWLLKYVEGMPLARTQPPKVKKAPAKKKPKRKKVVKPAVAEKAEMMGFADMKAVKTELRDALRECGQSPRGNCSVGKLLSMLPEDHPMRKEARFNEGQAA